MIYEPPFNPYDTEPTDAHVMTLPANLEAERAVLGSLLIDPDAIFGIDLSPADFYRERHGWIFEAMQALVERGEPIDFITLQTELERRGRLDEIGGPPYISDLSTSTPTSIYADHYAKLVASSGRKRRATGATQQMIQALYGEGDDDAAILEASKIWQDATLDAGAKKERTFHQIMEDVVNTVDARSRNQGQGMVATPWRGINNVLGGWGASDLIIVAARPGMGKTSLALSAATYAAKQGHRPGICALEMSADQLVQRVLSAESRIDSHRLRMGQVYEDEWPMLLEAANDLAPLPILVNETPGASITDIRNWTRRKVATKGLDMLIVDYLQLMTGAGKSENRNHEMGQITSALKRLAVELNVPVVALSQLSRAVEQRADKRPILSDLRDSGNLEQDADVVMFIYREDYYIEDTDRQNIADVIVAKHRHGSTGTVSLYFRKELTQFNDMEIERYDLDY